MRIGEQNWNFSPLGPHSWRGRVQAARLPGLARAVRDEGGQLVALWGSDQRMLDDAAGGRATRGSPSQIPRAADAMSEGLFDRLAPDITLEELAAKADGYAIHATFLTANGLVWISATLPVDAPAYPDLSAIFPQADRMQRAVYDLLGIRAEGAVDLRKWLRHGAWAEDEFPLRKDFSATRQAAPETDAYPFIRVEGDGVHEIPVGPIHAGVIEPGHFRFSVIGDRILKLEERLGYSHQGSEKRFEGLDLATGAKLAGRISGDSHSAFAWAYCMAVERATGGDAGGAVPDRALWLRALFLEMERIANHLGDLGYLGNDAALGFGFMQFWRLKEDWLRLSARLFGHRYLFDRIVPGGVAVDIQEAGRTELAKMSESVEKETRELKAIYDEHPGLQDRFAHTGTVTPDLAARLGLTGLAGRASGQAWDARVQFPQAPYDQLDVNMATHRRGDVLARAEVRIAEVFESLRLVREILARLPAGTIRAPLDPVRAACEGMGWVEGWRGEVVVGLRIGADGRLDRVHPHDPSWRNWPALELAVMDNIVPDFPLINKSFNLSYSGQDL